MLPESVVVARLRAAGCVFAEDEAGLLLSEADSAADLETMLDQRVAGLPLEHVLGWAAFYGLRIAVDPGVFVPRRRTEHLVREAAALASPGAVIVDLCCGSGAVAAALAAAISQAEVYAVDVEPAAVDCARRNLAAAGGQAFVGDLYDPLPGNLRGHVDILVANAPYVPTGAVKLMPPEARVYEPMVALDGGPDGLDVLRRVITAAPGWLSAGGALLFETSRNQSATAARAVAGAGLVSRVTTSDELSATVVVATRPGLRPWLRRSGRLSSLLQVARSRTGRRS